MVIDRSLEVIRSDSFAAFISGIALKRKEFAISSSLLASIGF